MLTYVARRVLVSIPTVFGVATVIFLMVRLLPGDPARVIAGVLATPEDVDRIRHQFGLDQPLYVQYVRYLGSVMRGELGTSWITSQPVLRDIAQRLAHPQGLTDAEARQLARDGKAFVHLDGGLHSTEVAGAQQTPLLAHDLVSRANDPQIKPILDNVDKIGYDHVNPLHSELVPLLTRCRAIADLTGEPWLFPSPDDASQAMTRYSATWRSNLRRSV